MVVHSSTLPILPPKLWDVRLTGTARETDGTLSLSWAEKVGPDVQLDRNAQMMKGTHLPPREQASRCPLAGQSAETFLSETCRLLLTFLRLTLWLGSFSVFYCTFRSPNTEYALGFSKSIRRHPKHQDIEVANIDSYWERCEGVPQNLRVRITLLHARRVITKICSACTVACAI